MRSRSEAPHHRRAVRRGAGAHPEHRAFSGRQLDSGAGHHLSRHHRIRRHRASRCHQDASQSRRGNSEADRDAAASSSRWHRSTKTKCARSARNWASPASFCTAIRSPARPGDSLPVLGDRGPSRSDCDPGWLLPIRSVGVQGRFAQLSRRCWHWSSCPTDEIATELVNQHDGNQSRGRVSARAHRDRRRCNRPRARSPPNA